MFVSNYLDKKRMYLYISIRFVFNVFMIYAQFLKSAYEGK